MAYRRRRSPTKGRKCIRKKRVRIRGGGTAMRCAKYGPKRGYRKSTKRRTTRRRTTRKPSGMARRGSRCTSWKRVRLRRKVGGRRFVKRCARYGR